MRCSNGWGRWVAVVSMSLSAGGCGLWGDDDSGAPAPVPVVTSVAPEPALPMGVAPVPADVTTPMRVTGTDFPVVALPSTITIRLTSALPIFAGGTTSSLDLAGGAATATTVDFVAPAADLGAEASVPVAMLLLFPSGETATLDPAFVYQAPVVPPATAPVLLSVAPQPALPVGVAPIPAVNATPMRVTGTDFPAVALPAAITVRLTAAAPIFAGGTTTSADVAATAATATTLDFTAPVATLDALDSAAVTILVRFPDGDPVELAPAFTYQAPAPNAVNTVVAGVAGASGILNPNLSTTGAEPIHLFARRGGDPFVLSPASGRTFGPLPIPAAGTVLGLCDVEFRTPGSNLWSGGADAATVTGEIVSNGAFWEIRGTTPGDLSNEVTGQAPIDAAVTVTFDDGARQAVPGAGARLVRTTQRVFAVVGGAAVAFGQNPGAAGLTASVAGSTAGSGPMAGDPERNRLYVASGATVEVFDTAACANASPAPTIGPRKFRAASPTGASIAFAGAALRSMAVDTLSGELWVVNDLGVQIADPSLPGGGIVSLPVPPGLGATTHGDRVVYLEASDEMLVSLFDGAAGAGTEAFLLYDVPTRTLEGIYPVASMAPTSATIGPNGSSLGNPTQQLVNDGSVNGASGQAVCSNVLTNNRPAATGAVWNREFAVRPSVSGSARVYLLFDNTGPTTGTIIAANACNGTVNGVPVGLASGVSICMPMDWVNTLDLGSGGMTNSFSTGAYPLGVGALTGPNAGERGSIAYDASRDEIVVHAATTGGSLFTFLNVSSAFVGPPSGPAYTAASFLVNSAALATMINNALTTGLTLNTPNAANAAVVPSQEHLRVLTAPGAVTPGGGGSGTISQVPSVPLSNPTFGAARGATQQTAEAILVDRVPGAANGTWFVFGGSAAGDLTKMSFDGTTVTTSTSAGAATLAPAAGATAPVFATSP